MFAKKISARTVKRTALTQREMKIVTHIIAGEANREIAVALDITVNTVKRHLSNIYDKSGMSTRVELAMWAIGRHITPSDVLCGITRDDIWAMEPF